MGPWLDVTRAATAVNLVLLVGLGYVWARNHLRARTKFTAGFLLFGAFLFAQNAFALYLYLLNPTTSRWFLEVPAFYNAAFMVIAVLQFGAIAALAWITAE